jgi:hypothetical protein
VECKAFSFKVTSLRLHSPLNAFLGPPGGYSASRDSTAATSLWRHRLNISRSAAGWRCADSRRGSTSTPSTRGLSRTSQRGSGTTSSSWEQTRRCTCAAPTSQGRRRRRPRRLSDTPRYRGEGTPCAPRTAETQAAKLTELSMFHAVSATRLDILQGALADDALVAARWAEALSFVERAASQGSAHAQSMFLHSALLSPHPHHRRGAPRAVVIL